MPHGCIAPREDIDQHQMDHRRKVISLPHPLDCPVWNALTSHWAPLAVGDRRAWRIDPAYGPFGAGADQGLAAQAAIAALVPQNGELWLVQKERMTPPANVAVARNSVLTQMTASSLSPLNRTPPLYVALSEADEAAMQALAMLTKPGPIHPRTYRLGQFFGVKREGRLVAMAGERMHMDGFTEVSGVCTHPDFRGRGYAGALMRIVAQAILDRGETPFLHAYADNAKAIALYEMLGFRVRADMRLMVLTR